MVTYVFRCYHKKQALQATEMAPQHPVSQQDLSELNPSQKALITKHYNDKDLILYTLPGGNICVPTLSEDDGDYQYTHVMSGKVSTSLQVAQAGTHLKTLSPL